MNYGHVYGFYFFTYIGHYLKAVCLENTQRKSPFIYQGLVVSVTDGSGRDVALLGLVSRCYAKVGKGNILNELRGNLLITTLRRQNNSFATTMERTGCISSARKNSGVSFPHQRKEKKVLSV
jgi:hypothetical protein